MDLRADPHIESPFPPGRFTFTPHEPMDDDAFFNLCQQVDPLTLERNPDGTIVVMSPAGSYSSNRSTRIVTQLQQWADKNDSGAVFDSSGGFRLPNGAVRAPDAAWVSATRLQRLPPEAKEGFLPLAPDFAVEVRSKNDARSELVAKMEEYLNNGTRLGWLIDPYDETVSVFQEEKSVETMDQPSALSGEPVLPGFTCDLSRVWDPGY
jgi:Uma2 family endonuclease